jgi:hypothetical protein
MTGEVRKEVFLRLLEVYSTSGIAHCDFNWKCVVRLGKDVLVTNWFKG